MKQGSSDTAATPVVVSALYMVVFYVVYLLLGYLLFGLGIAQLLVKFLSGKPQADLAKFGESLARYMAQIVEYIAMRSAIRPYPFSHWPSPNEAEGDER